MDKEDNTLYIIACYIGVDLNGTAHDSYSVDSRSPFGERLRALRTQRGLSQEKLCQMIKAHRNFVGYVERGQENICLDNILKLARALKVNPAELFGLYE
ncbi:MAG TPA: helix-turn-helix transcriptional regulator [Candidatus Angelobacter sp.]|nr:helix-turn-helix transcriptional regulator [Candidatus Angelobacter sp.]